MDPYFCIISNTIAFCKPYSHKISNCIQRINFHFCCAFERIYGNRTIKMLVCSVAVKRQNQGKPALLHNKFYHKLRLLQNLTFLQYTPEIIGYPGYILCGFIHFTKPLDRLIAKIKRVRLAGLSRQSASAPADSFLKREVHIPRRVFAL